MKYFLILVLVLIIALTSFYFFNDRIIKFYEEEPYPLFESDFSRIDTTGYLFDDPQSRYADYNKGLVYNISDYGAISGYYDGEGDINEEIIRDNTEAINRAIELASPNKAVVLIPEGNYVSGTIELKSNITLRISGNLIGSRNRGDYLPRHFIFGENIRNIVIEGDGGKIMGEGEYFWNNPFLKPLESNLKVSDLRMLQLNHFLCKREKKDNRPSPFMQFTGSENITVRNLMIENSPGWTLTFRLSNDILVRDVVLNNNIRGGNVDGIDIVATSNILIDNVLVSTADDAIVLKNPELDTSVSMTNITIRNAKISTTANGFKIGTETYSDINNVIFVDSEIKTTGFYPGAISGVAIESVDGSHVSNIFVDNITMRGVLAPLFIRVGNRNKYGSKDLLSSIDNVSISNISSYDCQLPSVISGVNDKGIILKATNIYINNFNVEYLDTPEILFISPAIPENPADYPEVWMFGDVLAYGIYIRHAEVKYENLHIIPRAVNMREEIVIDEGVANYIFFLFKILLIGGFFFGFLFMLLRNLKKEIFTPSHFKFKWE